MKIGITFFLTCFCMTVSLKENIPRHQRRGNVVFLCCYKIPLCNMAPNHITEVLVYMLAFNSNDPFPSKFLMMSFS